MYSEFIAVSETGELHQWKWSEAEPYKSEVGPELCLYLKFLTYPVLYFLILLKGRECFPSEDIAIEY